MNNFEKLYTSVIKEATVGGNTGIGNPTQAETQVTNPTFNASTKPKQTTPSNTTSTNQISKEITDFFQKNKDNPDFLKTLKTMLDEIDKQQSQQQQNAANQ